MPFNHIFLKGYIKGYDRKANGRFLVRNHIPKSDEIETPTVVLSVVHEGRATHHKVLKSSTAANQYTIKGETEANDVVFSEQNELADLIETLKTKNDKWGIRLITDVKFVSHDLEVETRPQVVDVIKMATAAAKESNVKHRKHPKELYRIAEKSLLKQPQKDITAAIDSSRVLDVGGCLISCPAFDAMLHMIQAIFRLQTVSFSLEHVHALYLLASMQAIAQLWAFVELLCILTLVGGRKKNGKFAESRTAGDKQAWGVGVTSCFVLWLTV